MAVPLLRRCANTGQLRNPIAPVPLEAARHRAVDSRAAVRDYYDDWCRENPGTIRDFLIKQGASDDVIAFVESQPVPLHGKLANEVRKGARTVEALEAFVGAVPAKREPDAGEKRILDHVARVPMDQSVLRWFEVQLLKHRSERERGERAPHWLHEPGWMDSPNNSVQMVAEVRDWARAENIDIASYSLERAVAESERWHEEQAAQGSGERYDGSGPTVHGYPDGWKLVRVVSQNDLDVEGNRMGHCVRGYGPQVERGESVIWSLRDPRNEPHVTIEIQPDKIKPYELTRRKVSIPEGRVVQIQGKGNREPIEEYQERLKAFFEQLPDGQLTAGSEDPEGLPAPGRNFRRWAEAVVEYLERDESLRDDYGLSVVPDALDLRAFFDKYDDAASEDRYAQYDEDVAKVLGAAAYRDDRRTFPRAAFDQVAAMVGEYVKSASGRGPGHWTGTRSKPLSSYGALQHRREHEDETFSEHWREYVEPEVIKAWRADSEDNATDYDAWQEAGGDMDDAPKELQKELERAEKYQYEDSENFNRFAGDALVEYERLAVKDGWLKLHKRSAG